MVKGTLNRTIFVENIPFIPKSGTTFPLLLTTPNPPYEELITNISFSSSMTDSKYYKGILLF